MEDLYGSNYLEYTKYQEPWKALDVLDCEIGCKPWDQMYHTSGCNPLSTVPFISCMLPQVLENCKNAEEFNNDYARTKDLLEEATKMKNGAYSGFPTAVDIMLFQN